jgi:hypothetical protein
MAATQKSNAFFIMEKWVNVQGYEGRYQVNEFGVVRNNKFELKQHLDKHGYKYVCLSLNGVQKKVKVHRIVLSSFIGNEPNLVCNHKDKNRTNNNLENLEWVTIHENNIHKFLDKKQNVGICFKHNKWYARVQINKVRKDLGYFNELKDAINARDEYLINNSIYNKY